jgi:hypothetical protein
MPPKGVATPMGKKKSKLTVTGSGRRTSGKIGKKPKVRRSSGIEREFVLQEIKESEADGCVRSRGPSARTKEAPL